MIKKLIMEVNRIFHPHKVYAVGGCVRDFVLGIKPKDYDFCTSASPEEIESLVKKDGRRAYCVGKKFGTIGFKLEGEMIEVTTFRTEKYEKDNRKPKVKFVKSINEDLSRRDFTINAMALTSKLKVIDPFGGQYDLNKKIIRCVGFATTRFREDPLRILRAIRFAARFGFDIEETTFERAKKYSYKIMTVSKERWVAEMDKLLVSEFVGKGIDYLWETGLMNYMLPELSLQHNYYQNSRYHNFTLGEHTKKVVMSCPPDILMRWAALLHDVAKPFVRTEHKKGHSNYIFHELLGGEIVEKIALYLKWSKDRKEKVKALVINHLSDESPLRKYDNESKIAQSPEEVNKL